VNETTRRAHELGRNGEDLAAAELAALGLEIVARNARTPSGEIDIVARDAHGLVFVEVKTRSGTCGGEPWEAVDASKRRRLEQAVEEYLEALALDDVDWRLAVVSIVSGARPAVEWIDDA
jgi:putative endonuclease